MNKFKTVVSTLSLATMVFAAGSMSAAAEDNVTDALTKGKVKVNMRLRYEQVDQDGITKDANSLTLRTRLGYETGEFKKFSLYGEGEDIRPVGNDNYNSTQNGKTLYPIVADPTVTEVNQAYVTYTGVPKTVLRYGRQRVILDDARFVGNVGWRQNEQTFDAMAVINNSLEDVTAVYGFVNNVNSIVGTDTNTKTQLLNVSYDGWKVGKLSTFAYLIDLTDAPTASTQTIGLLFTGKHKINDVVTAVYKASYASQSDYKDGDNRIDGDYTLIELGVKVKGITYKIGQEVLGADNFSGFETPLATKHAFNGWADKFLGTPVDGIEDNFIAVVGKVKGVVLKALYHDFSADRGSLDYGSEFDLHASKKFGKNYTVGIRYADYNADKFATDTRKVWLWTAINF